jgi:predicted transcriptional regulator
MEKTAKAQMIEIIQELPEDTSFDEILRELAFFRLVERGQNDFETGRLLSADEVRRRVRSWRRLAREIGAREPGAREAGS